jgi:hypothetical protein
VPELSPDVIAMLEYLVPGFIAAAIFYATTAHAKPSQFERLIQALILTVVVRAALVVEQAVALSVGRIFSFGAWTVDTTLVASVITAFAIGFIVSVATNRDVVHTWLRRFGATIRTSHPSEWFAVFSQRHRFVTLTLKDGSQLSGWPSLWPRDPEKGHFYITKGVWKRKRGAASTRRAEGILINATDVTQIEFMAREKT